MLPRRSRALLWLGGWLSVTLGLLLTLAEPQPGGVTGSAQFMKVFAGTNSLDVSYWIPAGRRRVTLESRSRVNRGAWTPRAVHLLDLTSPSRPSFSLPIGEGTEVLRLREESETELGLPLEFFQGTRVFSGKPGSYSGGGGGTTPPIRGGNLLYSPMIVGGGFDAGRALPSKVDFWYHLDGRLYLFSSTLGLQVVELSRPEQPRLVDRLSIFEPILAVHPLPANTPGSPRRFALLLNPGTTNACDLLMLRCEDTSGAIVTESRLRLTGAWAASALVEDTLHVAGVSWMGNRITPIPGGGAVYSNGPDRYETAIAGVRLRDPAHPEIVDTIRLKVQPRWVQVGPRHFAVATYPGNQQEPDGTIAPWNNSTTNALAIIDLTSDETTPRQIRACPLPSPLNFSSETLRLEESLVSLLVPVLQTNAIYAVVFPGGKTNVIGESVEPTAALETFSIPGHGEITRTSHLVLGTNLTVTSAAWHGARLLAFANDRAANNQSTLITVDRTIPTLPRLGGRLKLALLYITQVQEIPGNPFQLLLSGQASPRYQLQLDLVNLEDPDHPVLTSLADVPVPDSAQWSTPIPVSIVPETHQVWAGVTGFNGLAYGQTYTFATTSTTRVSTFSLDSSPGTLESRGTWDTSVEPFAFLRAGAQTLAFSASRIWTLGTNATGSPVVQGEFPLINPAGRVLDAGQTLIVIEAHGSNAPALRLVPKSDPNATRATVTLDELPVVGAVCRDGILQIVQTKPYWIERFGGLITNYTTSVVPQPPGTRYVTNLITEVIRPPVVEVQSTNVFIREEWVDQARIAGPDTNVVVATEWVPQPQSTNWIRSERDIISPPAPGEASVHFVHLTRVQPEYVPVPDRVTNYFEITTITTPRPPLTITNAVVTNGIISRFTESRSVLRTFSVADDGIRPLGELALRPSTNGWVIPLRSIRMGPNTEVWVTDSNGTDWNDSYSYLGPVVTTTTARAQSRGAARPAAVGVFFEWPGLSFHAVDLSEPSAPRLLSSLVLGAGEEKTNSWLGVSGVFNDDDKLYFSHRVIEWSQAPPQVVLTTNADGTISQQTFPGAGQSVLRHWLDVLDYADPEAPVVRSPVSIPNPIAGVSHHGQVVYASDTPDSQGFGDNAPEPILQALGYDGVNASLIGTLSLPTSTPRSYWISSSGTVWLGRPGADSSVSSLESWALGQGGTFVQTGTRPLRSSATWIGVNNSSLVVAMNPGLVLMSPVSNATAGLRYELTLFGASAMDWRDGAAEDAAGLWLARSPWGLLRIPFH